MGFKVHYTDTKDLGGTALSFVGGIILNFGLMFVIAWIIDWFETTYGKKLIPSSLIGLLLVLMLFGGTFLFFILLKCYLLVWISNRRRRN